MEKKFFKMWTHEDKASVKTQDQPPGDGDCFYC